MQSVERVIETYGGAAALARRLEISRNAVWLWRKTGRVPSDRVIDIERLTGIPRHEIRPDLWPVPSAGEAAA